ncbi:MAG: putative CRISPR-associated protein [Candidatus Micrarchaeota archaeon]|nr:putative CRISPR-associated protein [Candidatus Micrarchaeota archaeon]
MKKLITTVGTSIFENYVKLTKDSSIKDRIEYLSKQTYYDQQGNSRESSEKIKTSIVRSKLKEYIQKQPNLYSISAELKSISKIIDIELSNGQQEFLIYLLSSDTLSGWLASELVEESLHQIYDKNSKGVKIQKIEVKVIQHLQVIDQKNFNKGMANLISEVYSIVEEYWDNVVINITGGYKSSIPFLTILGQLNGCDIYYIYENTDTLIKIPKMPISSKCFDICKIDRYYSYFEELDKGLDDRGEIAKILSSSFYEDFSFVVWHYQEKDGELVELNPIGKILFEKYKENVHYFWSNDNVVNKILSSKGLLGVLDKFFKQIRISKTEHKGNQMVYDDGNNQIGIFYYYVNNQLSKDEELCIYEAFENHDKYRRYLEDNPQVPRGVCSKKYKYYDSYVKNFDCDVSQRIVEVEVK